MKEQSQQQSLAPIVSRSRYMSAAFALMTVIPLLTLAYFLSSYVIPHIVTDENVILIITLNIILAFGGFMLLRHDVKRKTAELEDANRCLRASEERHRALLETSLDLIYVIGRDDTVQYVNSAALKALRRPAVEVKDKPRASLFPPEIGARQKLALDRVFATGKPMFIEQKTELAGSAQWQNTQLVPLKGTGERVDAVLGISRDITERKRAEEELRKRRQELLHMERVQTMGYLASSLAHELNQPLAAILSNAQAAQQFLEASEPDMNQIREILADIVADDKRAGEVILRLRQLLRKEQPERKPIDVNGIVQDVILIVHSEAIIKNVSLHTKLASGLPLICMDRIQIEQVVLNLIINAEQAMAHMGPHERSIVVSSERDTCGGVLVSVRDTGPGIAKENMERVFEPFYTMEENGLGMGLAISRSIVTAHGGRIWAENNPDGGAKVCFTLPGAEGERGEGRGMESADK